MGILNQIVPTKVTKIPRTAKMELNPKKVRVGMKRKRPKVELNPKKVRAAQNQAQKRANLWSPANPETPVLLPLLPDQVARKALPEPT